MVVLMDTIHMENASKTEVCKSNGKQCLRRMQESHDYYCNYQYEKFHCFFSSLSGKNGTYAKTQVHLLNSDFRRLQDLT